MLRVEAEEAPAGGGHRTVSCLSSSLLNERCYVFVSTVSCSHPVCSLGGGRFRERGETRESSQKMKTPKTHNVKVKI